MRKFYSRILAVCMAGTMALTPFTPVGTLIGNTITRNLWNMMQLIVLPCLSFCGG